MSRKKDVIERQFRQALTEQAMKKVEKKRTRGSERVKTNASQPTAGGKGDGVGSSSEK